MRFKKPGGVVGIIDHVGPAGDTRALVEKLHGKLVFDPAVRGKIDRFLYRFRKPK